uniref:Guanylate cyclase domain-containing protein n=1 Tax=Romanomermis culicivorax TaxID=13658 RepID=A0A915K330_ROMCU
MDRIFRTLTVQRAIQIDRKLQENVLICSAPEIVRGELNINNKAVDIYQFAMIAYQIFYRKQPFEDASLSQSVPSRIQILSRMVANALKSGHQLPPEVFDSATVCFSSVVGFREITTNKKPTAIVNTLNMIYRLMDDTIANYDAYKSIDLGLSFRTFMQILCKDPQLERLLNTLFPVETVLDSYLIVSGVPTRNGNSHASYMADLSINLLKLSKKFHAPAILANHLTLRIGLNSGSVAAGVVGVTLPKYCLFGDTVNIASRVETDKIHISESVYSILESTGGYEMEKRGTVMLKLFVLK